MDFFNRWRRPAPTDSPAPKQAPRTDNLASFERAFPGVQVELKLLRENIEADPQNTGPLLERARYFWNSRLPSARLNCADDCSRALELDPLCAPAYRLRAEAVGKAPELRGKLPARVALDWLCAWALEPSDTQARAQFLKMCSRVFQGRTPSERADDIAALHEMLAARIGEERAQSALAELETDLEALA